MPSHVSLTELLHGGKSQALINTKTKNEILALNDKTRQYGLTLTEEEARELVITRNNALRENSRVEFGLGAVKLIIETFADSPYLDSDNYAEAINELTDIFYYVKSETDDGISDTDLVQRMKYYFEHTCEGSLELLMSRDLDELITDHNRQGGSGGKSEYEHVYRPLSEFFDLDETFNDSDFDSFGSSHGGESDVLDEKDLDYYDYQEMSESSASGKGIEDGGYGYVDEEDDYTSDDEEEFSISRFELENDELLSILEQDGIIGLDEFSDSEN